MTGDYISALLCIKIKLSAQTIKIKDKRHQINFLRSPKSQFTVKFDTHNLLIFLPIYKL